MNQSIYHVNERIFMLDCGRKYYSPDWIKRLILELEQSQMNTLYIHFAEDMGHRLESKQYPWLAGGDHTLCVRGSDMGIAEDDGKYLTQDEMREIVSFAGSHGVEIVPSLDSPGHMNYAVKKYNGHYGKDIGNYFIKNGSRHIVSGSSTVKENAALSASRGIDIANPEAVEFAKSLYREYGEFFRELGCKKFDIGGDELLGWGAIADPAYPKWQNLEVWDALAKEKTNRADAVAYDLFILYINEIASLMRSLGYESVRIWNDEVYLSSHTAWKGAATFDTSIDIQYWEQGADIQNTPTFYLDKGHRLLNFCSGFCYYVLGEGDGSLERLSVIEEEYNPYIFGKNDPSSILPAPDERVLGAALCLWCDGPAYEDREETLENLKPYIRAFAKKML